MVLNSTLSGGNLTNIRSNTYHTRQFVALVPNTIVCQATVATAPTQDVWATLAINSPSSGSVAAIQSFQTVVFSTTSDYRATETYRTYMRDGSSGTTLAIAQNSQALEVGDYITVLDTYEVFEKPAIERANTIYFDWDIPARRILPVETALPTAVALTDGETSYQPSPSVNGMDVNANSSWTYAWSSSNSNDSFSSTSALSPTITLEAASFRWLRFEFTNGGTGLTGLRCIAVWTVPADYSSVVSLGFSDESGSVADIGYDRELGFDCTLPAWDGISDVLPGTMLCVFSENWYNNVEGAIRTNIDFVGYLGEENTQTRADERYGVISETVFTCNSIASLIAATPVSTLSITATSTVAAVFDVENPTPVRIAHLLLSELSTVSHIASMAYFSDHTDFIGNSDVFSGTSDILFDALREILDTVNAVIQYDSTGRMEVIRNINELGDTARDAAITVVTLSPTDFTDNYRFVDNPVPTTRQLKVAGGWFDTSFDTYTPRIAFVPPIVDNRGTDKPEVVNQILTTDSTEAEAIAELSQRSANKYAALRNNRALEITLKDEWYFLIPDKGVWFKFTITAADTVRGIIYDSTTRWQLISIRYTTDNITGRRHVTARFTPETQSTGAFIKVTAPQERDTFNMQPITAPPYTDGEYEDWWDVKDPSDPQDPNPTNADCDQGGLRVRSPAVYTTSKTALFGELLEVTVSGSGRIKSGVAANAIAVDFDGAYTDYTTSVDPVGDAVTVSGGVQGGGNPNNCLVGQHNTSMKSAGVSITLTIDLAVSRTVTDVEYDVYSSSVPAGGGGYTRILKLYDTDNTLLSSSSSIVSSGTDGAWVTGSPFNNIDTENVRYVEVTIAASTSSSVARTIEIRMDNVTVSMDATPDTIGDPFYYTEDGEAWQAYDAGYGYQLNGVDIASIPPYNNEHTYTYRINGAQSGVQVHTFDSLYPHSEAENWSIQTKTCFLGVP